LFIRSVGAAHAAWEIPVDAYFQRRDGGWRLVGFERLPDNDAALAPSRTVTTASNR
jgi:hypothetical protein